MLKILKNLKTQEIYMSLILLIFIVAQVWFDLMIPDQMSKITMLVQTSGSAVSDIWMTGGHMLLCALGSLASAIIVSYLAARISSSFCQRLRSMLFGKVESFSMEEINRFSTSSLITRSTNDITQIQMLIVMALQFVIRAPIMAAWAITKIVGKGFEWSMATGITVAILMAASVLLMIFVMPKFKQMQNLTDNLTRVTRENLTGLRVVRACNAEKYQEDKFETANLELTDTQLFTNRVMVIMIPIFTVLVSGLSLAIYWIGAYLINNTGGDITFALNPITRAEEQQIIFANMIVFSQYAMQVVMAFVTVMMTLVMLPRASVSSKRINEVLDTDPKIKNGTFTRDKPDITGGIEFNNVSFCYPDAKEYVLQNVSFAVKQGETVAFIGSTGSGKSTLLNLILRFFDTTEGEVLIGGVNVKDYKLEELYSMIGYVPQKAVLFKGTVESNVAYGEKSGNVRAKNKPVKRGADSIEEAVRIAQASDFVEAMENGYFADIAQDGTNISGGQKQRLSIARAIFRKPKIYIFDDSFSALDFKTDKILRTELKKATAGATGFIVAQRIGTVMDVDRIIVLDEGRIVGDGTHKKLLRDCKVYYEIAISQLSEEELIK